MRFTAATCSRAVRCAARECLRSFRLTSGLERRWSGGLDRRARVRAQRQGIASRRRRGLNSAVVEARFGCQQVRPRGIDVLPHGRRGQQRTIVRRRDTRVRAVTAVHRDNRVSVRVARQKQQERQGEQAHQGTSGCRRHFSGCALTNCSNVRGSAPTTKRRLTNSCNARQVVPSTSRNPLQFTEMEDPLFLALSRRAAPVSAG